MQISKGKCAQRDGERQRDLVGSRMSVQQGRSRFVARSAPSVREHGKLVRTPLAAFFN